MPMMPAPRTITFMPRVCANLYSIKRKIKLSEKTSGLLIRGAHEYIRSGRAGMLGGHCGRRWFRAGGPAAVDHSVGRVPAAARAGGAGGHRADRAQPAAEADLGRAIAA